MKEQMDQMIHMMLKYDASDLHITKTKNRIKSELRTMEGMKEMHMAAFDTALFNYLKYLSDMDLANTSIPQSGNFSYQFEEQLYDFRFSCIHTLDAETGVLRILNNHEEIAIKDLSEVPEQQESFLNWTKTRSGLVVLSGPTGSGKTTTLHAIMAHIASLHRLNVVSLEDPIEIHDDSYLQLQINEKMDFTYEEGIRQLLRHDPDVIMIGEIRDPKSARMLLRSALSGHMIFTTIHAKCCSEAIKRLNEFGLSNEELTHTLTAICSQRLYASRQRKGRTCIYEILQGSDLQQYLSSQSLPKSHLDITQEIRKAIKQGKITSEAAQYDLPVETV